MQHFSHKFILVHFPSATKQTKTPLGTQPKRTEGQTNRLTAPTAGQNADRRSQIRLFGPALSNCHLQSCSFKVPRSCILIGYFSALNNFQFSVLVFARDVGILWFAVLIDNNKNNNYKNSETPQTNILKLISMILHKYLCISQIK